MRVHTWSPHRVGEHVGGNRRSPIAPRPTLPRHLDLIQRSRLSVPNSLQYGTYKVQRLLRSALSGPSWPGTDPRAQLHRGVPRPLRGHGARAQRPRLRTSPGGPHHVPRPAARLGPAAPRRGVGDRAQRAPGRGPADLPRLRPTGPGGGPPARLRPLSAPRRSTPGSARQGVGSGRGYPPPSWLGAARDPAALRHPPRLRRTASAPQKQLRTRRRLCPRGERRAGRGGSGAGRGHLGCADRWEQRRGGRRGGCRR